MTSEQGVVFDLGYQPHDGPRLGRRGAIFATIRDGLRRIRVRPWEGGDAAAYDKGTRAAQAQALKMQAAENNLNGLQEDDQIQQQGLILEVVKVVLEFFFRILH